jgi:hypothetical protein
MRPASAPSKSSSLSDQGVALLFARCATPWKTLMARNSLKVEACSHGNGGLYRSLLADNPDARIVSQLQ